jgi:hypothetical protein
MRLPCAVGANCTHSASEEEGPLGGPSSSGRALQGERGNGGRNQVIDQDDHQIRLSIKTILIIGEGKGFELLVADRLDRRFWIGEGKKDGVLTSWASPQRRHTAL